jgi:hypothetical protein
MMAVLSGTLPTRPADKLKSGPRGDHMWELLLKCWDREPGVRPPAKEMVELVCIFPDAQIFVIFDLPSSPRYRERANKMLGFSYARSTRNKGVYKGLTILLDGFGYGFIPVYLLPIDFHLIKAFCNLISSVRNCQITTIVSVDIFSRPTIHGVIKDERNSPQKQHFGRLYGNAGYLTLV